MESDRPALVIAPPEIARETSRRLVFSVGELRCSLTVGSVGGVLRTATLRRVPLAPDCVLGLLERHGGVVTVLDPAPLLRTGHGAGDPAYLRLSRPWDHLALRVEEPLRVVDGNAAGGGEEPLDLHSLVSSAEAAVARRPR